MSSDDGLERLAASMPRGMGSLLLRVGGVCYLRYYYHSIIQCLHVNEEENGFFKAQ